MLHSRGSTIPIYLLYFVSLTGWLTWNRI